MLPEIRTNLRRQAELWKREGFIHGDLSLRNMLVNFDRGPVRLWFIDWITDLNSFEGTPRYASSEVYRGRRSHDSDRYAIEQILCILEGYR